MAFYVGLCKEKYVKRNKENVCMKEKLVSENSRKKKTKLFAWKSQSSICTRFYQKLPRISLLLKARSLWKWSYKNLLTDNSARKRKRQN